MLIIITTQFGNPTYSQSDVLKDEILQNHVSVLNNLTFQTTTRMNLNYNMYKLQNFTKTLKDIDA